jgi:hypothetical protein
MSKNAMARCDSFIESYRAFTGAPGARASSAKGGLLSVDEVAPQFYRHHHHHHHPIYHHFRRVSAVSTVSAIVSNKWISTDHCVFSSCFFCLSLWRRQEAVSAHAAAALRTPG